MNKQTTDAAACPNQDGSRAAETAGFVEARGAATSECAPCLIETIEKNRLCVVPPNQETPDWTVYAEFDGEFGYDNEIGAGATLRDALQMAAAAIADTEDVR